MTWKVTELSLVLLDQLTMESYLSDSTKIFKYEEFVKPILVAKGTAYYNCDMFFRIIGKGPRFDLELNTFNLKTFMDEKVWIPFSFYHGDTLLSKFLQIDHDRFKEFQMDIYSYILHEIIKRQENIEYPMVVEKGERGAWRTVCTGPNEFVWEDVVTNNLKEKHFVPRIKPNGYEIGALVDLIKRKHMDLV